MKRYWINQPSTLQLCHDMHGQNVLARKGYDGNRQDDVCTRVYFTSGCIISTLIPTISLSTSEGWNNK